LKKDILEILDKNNYVSGEKIAEKLGVSRTAVWKQISTLKDMGYKINSVKNKGYKLLYRPDKPFDFEINKDIDTKVIGKKIEYFKSISSTNSYIKKNIEKKFSEGTIFVTDIQTDGRGRKNRSWSSKKGGLWFSVVLYPDVSPNQGILITMAASISIYHAINEITGIKPTIKWPNDLLINNKKICGILTEFDAETDKINYAIVGIGINVNNHIDKSLKNIATSIKEENNGTIQKVELLKEIIVNFDKYYLDIKNQKNENIRKEWLKYSNIIGRRIRVKQNNNFYEGIVKNVDKNGFLILDLPKGEMRILSGDVEYL